VKIADFGITKRAEDGMTALRTVSGTPGYQAPEILVQQGYLQTNLVGHKSEYSLAVDAWSMGEVTYRCLCGESPLLKSLSAYVNGTIPFPTGKLLELDVSEEGRDLIQTLMLVNPEERLKASDALKHPWFAAHKGSPRSSAELSEYVLNRIARTLNEYITELSKLGTPRALQSLSTLTWCFCRPMVRDFID
jgi:serine/threonine protein kinase